jgi:hypothetical protein
MPRTVRASCMTMGGARSCNGNQPVAPPMGNAVGNDENDVRSRDQDEAHHHESAVWFERHRNFLRPCRLKLQFRDDRHVIRWLFPIAGIAQHPRGFEVRF